MPRLDLIRSKSVVSEREKVAEQLVLLLRIGGKQSVVHGKDAAEECQIRQEPFLTF